MFGLSWSTALSSDSCTKGLEHSLFGLFSFRIIDWVLLVREREESPNLWRLGLTMLRHLVFACVIFGLYGNYGSTKRLEAW
jgi:hypothetical protein